MLRNKDENFGQLNEYLESLRLHKAITSPINIVYTPCIIFDRMYVFPKVNSSMKVEEIEHILEEYEKLQSIFKEILRRVREFTKVGHDGPNSPENKKTAMNSIQERLDELQKATRHINSLIIRKTESETKVLVKKTNILAEKAIKTAKKAKRDSWIIAFVTLILTSIIASLIAYFL